MHEYKLSVIMPALNEERSIRLSVMNVLDSFQRYLINGELIIVNDGSSDKTAEISEELAFNHHCISVLNHSTPLGVGVSVWDGVQGARGEIVVYLPGDGENDAADIFRYISLLDHVDIVVPFVFNPEVRPWQRRTLSSAYHKIIRATSSLSLRYMNGTIMYRKSILKGIDLKSRGFFFQTELLLKTVCSGYLYAEVPYALKNRHAGKSKSTTLKSLYEVARAYCTTIIALYLSFRCDTPISHDSMTAKRINALVNNNE